MTRPANRREQEPGVLKQESFVGGVYDFLPRHLIPDNGMCLAENVEFHITGTVRRRGGLRRHQEHTAESTDHPLLLKSAVIRQTAPFLVALYNVSPDESHVVIDQGLGDPIDMTLDYALDDRADVIQLLDRIYVCQPGQPPSYWEAGSTTMLRERATPGFPGTTIPYIATGVYFQGLAYGAGDLAKPDLLYFSSGLGVDGNGEANGALFTWDKDFQAFRMQTGRIEAVTPFRQSGLIIFTDRGIESFEPNCCDPLQPHRFTLNMYTGCASKHTVQLAGEDIFFMDQEGHIRSLNQTELDENHGVTNAPLSLRIQNVINRQTKNALRRSRAAFSKGIYWIAFPTNFSQYPNELWGWSIRDQAWIGPYRFGLDVDGGDLDGLTIGGLVGHKFDGDDERLYVLLQDEETAIRTYIALDPEDYTDDGVLIPVQIEGKSYMPADESKKTWFHIEHELRFLFSPGDQPVDVEVDVRVEEQTWVNVGTETFACDSGPNLPQPMPIETVIPYGRQDQKLALTSKARGYGCEPRIKIRDDQTQWEIISQQITAQTDDQSYSSGRNN